ncbi:hypothetical protein TKK_0003969 [Trichogramma kaykai]
MENATKEAYKFYYYREQDGIFSLQPIEFDIVGTLVEKMKLDKHDKRNCEMKMLHEMFAYQSSMFTLEKCIKDNSTKSLEPVIEALKELDHQVFLIDYNIERAKKCAGDATSTPSSATKCLKEVEFVVNEFLDIPEIGDLKNEYNQFLKKLEECKSLKKFEDLNAQLGLASSKVMNCTIELLKKEGLSLNLSDI